LSLWKLKEHVQKQIKSQQQIASTQLRLSITLDSVMCQDGFNISVLIEELQKTYPRVSTNHDDEVVEDVLSLFLGFLSRIHFEHSTQLPTNHSQKTILGRAAEQET